MTIEFDWPDGHPIPDHLVVRVGEPTVSIPDGPVLRTHRLPLRRVTVEGPADQVEPFAAAILALCREHGWCAT